MAHVKHIGKRSMKNKSTSKRIHIIMPLWLINAIGKKAAELGISNSEYIRDLLKRDLSTKTNQYDSNK